MPIKKCKIWLKASVFIFALFAFSSFPLVAQTVENEPPIVPKPSRPPMPPKIGKFGKLTGSDSEIPSEKSIPTDANVNILLCISEGNVKINGWQRNEIRAFVRGETAIGFQVLERKNQTPVWVKIINSAAPEKGETGADDCLSGGNLELDVPFGTNVNLKGDAGNISIESVNKVKIENISGSILLRRIARGVEAKTFEGNVTVEESGGAMTLVSNSGNIFAFETAPVETGDVFTAKSSSGAIILQSVAHKQIEAGSNTGAIRFDGAFSAGGQYALGTTNGSITLKIPAESSFRVNASYGYGAFQTEIPLRDISQTAALQARKLTAVSGAGDANLNLTTFSGAIRIVRK